VNRAPDAVFVPTPQDVTERILAEAGVKKGDVVVDLGSGDGRIVITAARKYGCKAIGYEIDPMLVAASRDAVAQANLQDLVKIEQVDIFTVDLSGADVVTTFLYPRLMQRLLPQFEKLKPGSRIISHQFELPDVKPDHIFEMESEETGDRHQILLWKTPLKKQ
jgi:tRNA A58 N-methylase Trm61